MDPLWIRYLHIIGATLLFGTGLGTAFHGYMAYRSGNVQAVSVAARNVVLADWLFTAPAVVLQPVTGIALALQYGYPLTSGWIVASLLLYAFIGACWLPVVWLQVRMAKLARAAQAEGAPLPPAYYHYLRLWFALGWPAFAAILVIFYLMLNRPSF